MHPSSYTHNKQEKAQDKADVLTPVAFLSAGDAFHVAPGQGLALPVLAGSHEMPGPRLAGDPTTFSATASPRSSLDSTAAASADSGRHVVLRQHAVDSHLQDRRACSGKQRGSQQRALLYFQLAGHELPCGPIPLERLSTASQTVCQYVAFSSCFQHISAYLHGIRSGSLLC